MKKLEIEHRQGNSFASLQCARVDKSIIYVTTHNRKALINMLSCSKTSKTQPNAVYRHKRKNSELFDDTKRVLT